MDVPAGKTGNGLVGRDEDILQLTELVAQLAEGRGGVGWVQGEPGIGKSALLAAVGDAGRRAGCRVLFAAGDELMRAFPLRLMVDCLRISNKSADLAVARIAELLLGQADTSTTADPVLVAGERMLDLVDRMCTEGPLMLVLEDLHWADEPSLLLWNRLARSTDQIPLLLLGSCRSAPQHSTLARLREVAVERGGAVRDLLPLGGAAVASLTQMRAGGAPGPRLAAELDRAGGNPLYVLGLLDALIGSGAIEVAGGVAEVRADARAIPASLGAAIGRRLGPLSETTISALRVAAVLGHEFDVGQWTDILGAQPGVVKRIVEEAAAAGVLTAVGELLAFRHDVVRQVLVEQIPAPVRTQLHRHAAWVLSQADAGLDEVARHLLAATGRFEGWVALWLDELPENVLYTAPRVAVLLLERAAREQDTLFGERLNTRLADLLFLLGRDEEAVAVAGDVLSKTSNVARAAGLRILLIRCYGRRGMLAEALASAQPALTDPGTPSVWRARIEAWAGMILAYQHRIEEARDHGERALRVATEAGDALGAGYAHNTLAFISPLTQQLEHLDAALSGLGDNPEAMDLRMLLLGDRVQCLLVMGRRAEVDEALADSAVFAERLGTVRSGGLLARVTDACYLIGEWGDATAYADSLQPLHRDNPSLAYLQAVMALIALHREDRDLAEQRLRQAGFLDEEGEGSGLGDGAVVDALATLAEFTGYLDRALRLRRTWLDAEPGPVRGTRFDEPPHLVRLALATGDEDLARTVADVAVERGDQSPAQALTNRLCRTMLDADPAALVQIAGEYATFGWPLHRGFALEEAAAALARTGALIEARAYALQAVDAYALVGASWDIRRADARLRSLGIRRCARPLRRRATQGWDSLTPSELRIAKLVAKGLSNPDIAAELFLSRNTVQTHVSHILVKLQLRSRVALIHEVASRPSCDQP